MRRRQPRRQPGRHRVLRRPRANGGFHGLQAEKARIPYANIGLIRLPSSISDDQAILLSDIFPTGYFGAELAGIAPGNTVAVFGCGPVGQFAIASALLLGAARCSPSTATRTACTWPASKAPK